MSQFLLILIGYLFIVIISLGGTSLLPFILIGFVGFFALMPWFQGQQLLAIAGFLTFLFFMPGLIATSFTGLQFSLLGPTSLLTMFGCSVWQAFTSQWEILTWLLHFLPKSIRNSLLVSLFIYFLPGIIALVGSLAGKEPLFLLGIFLLFNSISSPFFLRVKRRTEGKGIFHQVGVFFYEVSEELLNAAKALLGLFASPSYVRTAEQNEKRSRFLIPDLTQVKDNLAVHVARPNALFWNPEGGTQVAADVRLAAQLKLPRLKEDLIVTFKLKDQCIKFSTFYEKREVYIKVDPIKGSRIKEKKPFFFFWNSSSPQAIVEDDKPFIHAQLEAIAIVLCPLIQGVQEQIQEQRVKKTQAELPAIEGTFVLRPLGTNTLYLKTPQGEFKTRVHEDGSWAPLSEVKSINQSMGLRKKKSPFC